MRVSELQKNQLRIFVFGSGCYIAPTFKTKKRNSNLFLFSLKFSKKKTNKKEKKSDCRQQKKIKNHAKTQKKESFFYKKMEQLKKFKNYF